MKMSHSWTELEDHRFVEYSWGLNKIQNSFSVKATLDATIIEENSQAEFITEHYWGYAKAGQNSTFEYEVTHPRWDVYEVSECEISVNYGPVYGEDFAELSNQEPASVMLAEGSQITVENKKII